MVACEGAYGSGNSALTLYYPDSGQVVEDAYRQANGLSLGDVFQSLSPVGNNLFYLCINNSDRLVAIARGTYVYQAAINIPKPRYLVPVNAGEAYVSTLFSNKIYVVSLPANTVVKTIAMPAKNPEGMLLRGDRLWVATWDTASTAIYAIDTATDAVTATVNVAGRAPQEILEDREGMLWVLSGNKAQGAESYLTRINPATGAILKSYAFGSAEPIRPVFNATRDTLYFIEVSYSGGAADNGVYRMSIHDAALPQQAFIPAKGLQYFWGVGIHPANGYIYIADPKGFTQKGIVRIYQPNGSIADSFATGVGPGHFYFD